MVPGSRPSVPFWLRGGQPWHVAVLVAVVAASVTFGRSVFSASISDTSGYVAAAEGVRTRRLPRPEAWQLIPAISTTLASTSPLAFGPGVERGTEVPRYPLGLPYLMATVSLVAGPLGAFAVAPLMFGVLVWLTYVLARDLGGEPAGVAAAVLAACDPASVLTSVWAISDVPAAAGWMSAWYFAQRGTSSGALVAGVSAAMAIMIRPNLGPLVVVPGATCLWLGARFSRPATWHARRAAVFALTAAIGPAMVVWSYVALYGGPLQSGYPIETLFSLAHLRTNLAGYPQLYVEVHGWSPLVAACLPLVLLRRLTPPQRTLVISGLALAAINFALYLPYLPQVGWSYLRFFLPASTVVIVFAAGGLGRALAVTGRLSTLRYALPLLAVLAGWQGREFMSMPMSEQAAHARIPLMGHYLREALPRNAVVLGYLHGGAVAHYTGRSVIGVESMAGQMIDDLVRLLQNHGQQPVFVLDQQLEDKAFKDLFAGSEFGSLDWPPRATFVSTSTIRYFDPADRARHRAGVQWPVDVVR